MAKLGKMLTPELIQKVIYVADSAMVTETNLEQAAGYSLRFISRFPGNFALEKELKERAWQIDNWEHLLHIFPGEECGQLQVSVFYRRALRPEVPFYRSAFFRARRPQGQVFGKQVL